MMKANDLIFIVEDDEFYVGVMKSFLGFKGYENVQIFTNEKDALANLYRCPSLVILDYNLDDVIGSGKVIFLEIIAFNPNIPVIFISGQKSIQEAISTLKMGAYDYIQKNDHTFERLANKINEISINQNKIKSLKRSKKLRNGLLIAGFAASVVILSLFMF